MNRKSTRIPGYNYGAANYYFVTICAHEKKCIFGNIHEKSALGMLVDKELSLLHTHYQDIFVDKYIVMPNHIHAIIAFEKNCKNSLSDVIGLYKSGVSRKYGKTEKLWQRSFHDHIIRNEQDYLKIWEYINSNFQKWNEDCFYVETI